MEPDQTQDIASKLEALEEGLHALETDLEKAPAELDQHAQSLLSEIERVEHEVAAIAHRAEEDGAHIAGALHKVEAVAQTASGHVEDAVTHTKDALTALTAACHHSDAVLQDGLHHLSERIGVTKALLETRSKQLVDHVQGSEGAWGSGVVHFSHEEVRGVWEGALQTATQSINEIHEQLIQHQLPQTIQELESHTRDCAENISQLTQQFGDAVGRSVGDHVAHQAARIADTVERVRDMGQHLQATAAELSKIINGGIDSARSLTDELGEVNTGLKVTFGTVDKMRQVLEDVG